MRLLYLADKTEINSFLNFRFIHDSLRSLIQNIGNLLEFYYTFLLYIK